MADRENALDALSREELGGAPEELGGSASGAAVSSYLFFCVGAVVPVLPFFFGGWPYVVASALASAVGLFGLGAVITLFTGRNVLFSGGRQGLIGAAAALTYGLGLLLGVSVGG